MELFELDPNDYTVRLNRAWLWMIPEFADILKRDKGSPGDKGGPRKLWSRKRFAYIYFFADFKSPIYSWEENERREEAMRYTGLDKNDIAEPYVVAAMKMYRELQRKAARSLRTLDAVHKGLSQLNKYFEDIDFTKVDKQGKVLYSAKEYVNNIKELDKAYDALAAFEKRVMAELTKAGGIRGSATKGDRENNTESSAANPNKHWEEGGDPEDSSPQWLALSTGTDFNTEL